MASFSAKHLHFVPFNVNPVAGRSRLLAASPNGLIFSTRDNDLIVFRVADYVGASAISNLRKDKPLDSLRPNISLSFSRQITWLAVNCNGSLLSVCSSMPNGVTFIQLLEISKMSPTENFGFLGEPLNLSAAEAGAEANNSPQASSAIADLAWSPVDPNRLAVATQSGSLRMFVCSGQDVQKPLTLVGTLPQAAQVKCISWSPKGKQLAVCLTGIIPNFPAVPTTVILQLDPELRQKRVIPLSPILQSFAQFPQGRPIDMLWSSSYCFLVALEGPTPQQGTCVAFVSALPKSEPRGALVESLAGVFDSTAVQPFQYHMRLWPNSGCLVAATWSSGGETCILLDVPALSSTGGGLSFDSLPKLLTEMVLPSTRAPIALGMSAVLKDAEVLPLLVTRLGNGIVCAYEMLQGPNADPAAFAGFRTWLQAAAPAPNLPASPPAAVQPTMTTTTTTSAQAPAPTTKGATSTLAAATTAAGLFGGSTFNQQSASTTPAHPGTAATTTGLFGGPAFDVSSATPTAPSKSMFVGTLFGQKSAPDVSSPPTSVFGGTLFGQKSAPDVSSATPTTPPTSMFGGTLFGQQSAPNVSAATTTAAASSLFGSTVFARQSAQGPQATVSSADANSTTTSPAAQPASPLKASTQAKTAPPPTSPPSIFSSSSGGLFGSGVGGQPTGASGFGATTFGRPSTPQQTFGLPVTTTTAAVPNASVGAPVTSCTEPIAAQSPTSPRGDVPLPAPPPPLQELKSPDLVSTTPHPLKQEAPEETRDLDRAPSPAPIPHSVLEASEQFSLALQAQATDTARAWQHLTEVFSGTSVHLAALASVSGLLPAGCCKGVRDIEKSLTNMSTYLDVVNEITRQLEKATALSLAEQKSLADFVGRLHVDFEAYADNLAPKFTAGLDPESAAMLASLKKKSRSAETYLAELEDQLESLSTQVEEEAAAEKSKSSLPHEPTSSPLESVRRTLAVNARLIAAERARIEMISRFSGISLSSSQIAAASPVHRRAGDTPQTPNSAGGRSANYLTRSASSRARLSGGSSLRASAGAGAPTKSLPLGGSVVSLEREQRDAALYRLLVKAAASAGGSQALPIHRAAQTAGQLFESTATRGTLDQSAADVDKKSPSRATQRQSPRVRSSPAAAGCVSPGRIQGQQISRLLDRAASVPPVTLPTGGSPLPVVEPSAVAAGTSRSPPPPARSESFLSSAQSRLHGRSPVSTTVSPHALDTALASPMAPEGAGSSPVAAAAPRITSTPRWSVQPPGLTVKPPVGHVFQAGATTTPSAPASRLPTTTKKPEKPKSKPESGNHSALRNSAASFLCPGSFSLGQSSTQRILSTADVAKLTTSPAASVRTPPSSDSPKATSLSTSLVSPPVMTTLSPTVKVFGAPRNLVFETSQTLPTVTQSPAVPQIVVSPSTAGESAASTTTTSAATTPAPATSMTAVAPSTTAVTTTSSTGLLSKLPTASSASTTTTAAPTPAASSVGLFAGQPIVGFGAATSQPTATSSPPAAPISFGLFGQASKAPPAAPKPLPVTTTAPVSSSAPAASSVSSLFAQPKFSATTTAAASPTTTFSFGPVSAAATTATTGFGSPFVSTPTTATPMTTAAAATSATSATAGAGPVSTSAGGLFATVGTKSTESSLFGQPGGLFGSPSKTSSGLFGQQQPAASADGGLFGGGGQKAAANAAASAATTTATAGVGFFGSPNTSSGAGLFGDTKTASTTTAGGLFGGPSATGGLFGAPAATAGQLFGSGGQSTAAVGAFGTTSTASPSATAGGGLFGQAGAKPATGGLFGAAAGGGGGGLFGQTAVSPGGGLFGQMAATSTSSSAPALGLFGSPAAAAPSGGLFGTPTQAQQSGAAAVSNLFATSNFGLGSPSTTSSSGGSGGLFGKPAASNTSVPGSTGLFGSPTSTAAPGGGGLFGTSATPKPASPNGLFAAPTLGKTVFGTASTGAGSSGGLFGSFTNTTGGGGGGLFGAASNTAAPGGGGGGGLFGSLTAAPSSGGLFSSAAAPASGGLFGAGSGFGAPPAFGSVNAPQANPLTFPIPSSPSAGAGGFGSAPVFGQSSPFGAAAAASPAAGGLFASLANSANASTFGSLAHNTPSPPAPQNLFGSSPSFTQRRA